MILNTGGMTCIPPFLIGDKMPEDVVHMARQESYRSGQLKLLF